MLQTTDIAYKDNYNYVRTCIIETSILCACVCDYCKPLQNGCTPLYIACEHNRVEVAQLLLNNGATVDMNSNVSEYKSF